MTMGKHRRIVPQAVLSDKNAKRTSERIDEELRAHGAVWDKTIAFVRAKDPLAAVGSANQKGLRPLNRATAEANAKALAASAAQADPSGYTPPDHRLFDAAQLQFAWDKPRPIGPGLNNLGNTCYLNSVLQCLCYTPALASACVKRAHTCQQMTHGFDALRLLETHVQRCIRAIETSNRQPISPKAIVNQLRLINRSFKRGQQQDAHEFLRCFMDTMQDACLHGVPKGLDHPTKATTLIHAIFGGVLRSQVRCTQCKHVSNTFDHCLDLSLEMTKSQSLEQALSRHTTPERLSETNEYKCDGCKQMVNASKQITVHCLPNVLSLQLKRFSFLSMFGTKNSKHISFPTTLDMRPYLSDKKTSEDTQYELYGVLVHSGYSLQGGHYYCFVKNSNNAWYRMDDSSVSSAGISTVLKQEAYLLFYRKRVPARLPLRTPASQGKIALGAAMEKGLSHTNGAPIANGAPVANGKAGPGPQKQQSLMPNGVTAAHAEIAKPHAPAAKKDQLGMSEVAAAESTDDESEESEAEEETAASVAPRNTAPGPRSQEDRKREIEAPNAANRTLEISNVYQPVSQSTWRWTVRYQLEPTQYSAAIYEDYNVSNGWKASSEAIETKYSAFYREGALVSPEGAAAVDTAKESTDGDSLEALGKYLPFLDADAIDIMKSLPDDYTDPVRTLVEADVERTLKAVRDSIITDEEASSLDELFAWDTATDLPEAMVAYVKDKASQRVLEALQASLMEAGGDDEEPDESSSVASDSSSASEEDDAAALTDLLEEIVQSPTKTANGSNASPASSSTDEDDADSNMSDDDAQLGVQMSDEDEDEESEEESEGGKGDGAEQDEEETPAKRAKHEPIVAIFEPGARTSRTTAKSAVLWDGSKSKGGIARQLHEQATNVATWDGGASHTLAAAGYEDEVDEERDAFDEEIDVGRVKKVRANKIQPKDLKDKFQKLQEMKKQELNGDAARRGGRGSGRGGRGGGRGGRGGGQR